MNTILQDRITTTLDAGATELLGATGISVADYDRISFVVKNLDGAAALTGLSVYWCDDSAGTDWSPADGTIALVSGTLAAGGTIEVLVTDLARQRMRIAVTGTAAKNVRLSLTCSWRARG